MNDLIPCPFCGSPMVEMVREYAHQDPKVWCRDCNALVASMVTVREKGMAKLWNTRV